MTTLLRIVSQVPVLFMLSSQMALASVGPTPSPKNPAPAVSGAAALTIPASPPAASGPDCVKICDGLRAKLRTNAHRVDGEYQIWQQRLGVKADVIRYPQGFSAAEELLHFMSSYYMTKAPDNQMDSGFLTFLMGKCFPEAYIDTDRARLSGLVDTIWLAQNVRLGKTQDELTTCR